MQLNSYLSNKLNTNLEGGFISFNGSLKYSLQDIHHRNETKKVDIKIDKLNINIKILPLLFGKIYIKKTEIDNLYIKHTKEDDEKIEEEINISNIENIPRELNKLFVDDISVEKININNNIELNNVIINYKDNEYKLLINNGNFFLKEYFNYKIDFKDLDITLNKNDDKIKEVKIHSLVGEMDFNMQILNNGNKKELNFFLKNISLNKLKIYWPNFIDKDVSRKWVLEHIISGKSKDAIIKTNFENNQLNDFYIETKMDDVLLNYSDNFPNISNINGTAIFTDKGMDINIANAKVLNSKLTNANVKMNFTKQKKELFIVGNVNGKIIDIFTHIDKNKKSEIESIVNKVIVDYNTITNVKIMIPVYDVNFKNVEINATSTIKNKKNNFFKNEKLITLDFKKLKNSNIFLGNINLTQNLINTLIFNKKENIEATIDYICEVEKNNEVKIKEIKLNSTNGTIVGNGYVNNFKLKISQNNNIFDLEYTPKKYNIFGKQLDISNFSFDLENTKTIERTISMKIDKVLLKNNVIINNFDLEYDGKLNLNSDLLKIENSSIITLNDIGKIVLGLDLNDKITDGKGSLKIYENNKKEKKISAKISNFDIKIAQENGDEKKINIETLDGEFKIENKILEFSNVMIKPKKEINIEVIASGNFDFDTYKTDIIGIITLNPYGINSLETLSLLSGGLLIGGPVGLIGGGILSKILNVNKQNDRIFASKFAIYKKDKNSKMKFTNNSMSILLPGFLRDLFF